MGSLWSSQPTEYQYNNDNRANTSSKIPKATYCVDDINFIAVTPTMAQYIINMINDVQELFEIKQNNNNANIPSYSKLIDNRLKNFNMIQENICAEKYKNIGEILSGIDCVWKSMYQLTEEQIQNNEQHDPHSDFITFASGIESEFYKAWDKFENVLIEQGYLKQTISTTQQKQQQQHKKIKIENNKNNENNPVKQWLQSIKLSHYHQLFDHNGYDDMSFITDIITDDDLKNMGIDKIGHRRKILHYSKSCNKHNQNIAKRKRSRDSNIVDNEIQDELSQTQRPNKRRKISRSISGNNEIYVYNDLSQFTNKTPIILKKTYDLVIDGYIGFAFINILDHKIKLKDMFFSNQTGSLKVVIPYKTLPRNGIIRLIITEDPRNPMIKQNDILIRPETFRWRSDRIFLNDSRGNQYELCDTKAINLDRLQDSNDSQTT